MSDEKPAQTQRFGPDPRRPPPRRRARLADLAELRRFVASVLWSCRKGVLPPDRASACFRGALVLRSLLDDAAASERVAELERQAAEVIAAQASQLRVAK